MKPFRARRADRAVRHAARAVPPESAAGAARAEAAGTQAAGSEAAGSEAAGSKAAGSQAAGSEAAWLGGACCEVGIGENVRAQEHPEAER